MHIYHNYRMNPQGVKEYGYQNLIVEPNSPAEDCKIKSPGGDLAASSNLVLYFRNLQWRSFSSNNAGSIPALYVTEQSQITTNPREEEPRNLVRDILNEIGNGLERRKFIAQAKNRLSKLLSTGGSRVGNISSTPKQNNPTPKPSSAQTNTPKDRNSNCENEIQAFSTPLSSRRTHERPRGSLVEKLMVIRGNVECVPDSPAAKQSEKTRQKINALHIASEKLSHWKPA